MTERSTATDVIMELSRENLSLRRELERHEKWKEAVDRELVISLQCTTDSYNDPHKAVSDLIDWHIQVAIDPRCNGGYGLVNLQSESVAKVSSGYSGDPDTKGSKDVYKLPALDKIDSGVCIGDELIVRPKLEQRFYEGGEEDGTLF